MSTPGLFTRAFRRLAEFRRARRQRGLPRSRVANAGDEPSETFEAAQDAYPRRRLPELWAERSGYDIRQSYYSRLPGAGPHGGDRGPQYRLSPGDEDAPAFIQPRMAGSTEMCETATVNWPGPGAGAGSLVSSQSVARGSPDGRAASRTWWLVSDIWRLLEAR